MQILICDDNRLFLQKMQTQLMQYGQELGLAFSITAAESAQEVSQLDLSQFDIAFLDIDMGELNGIDIARTIRQKRRDTVILFVTNYLEYAPEGYEVQAFRYLLKSELNHKLGEYLQDAVRHFQSQCTTLTISISGEATCVPVPQISYAEAQGRTVVLYLDGDTTYQFYSTLTKLEEELTAQGFLRIQKSFLVNMHWIQKMSGSGVVLKNGKELPVSKKNYAEIRKAFMLWRGNHRWI